MATQYGWVIEHADSSTAEPLYWSGGVNPMSWNKNNRQAIRFARDEDARMFMSRCLNERDLRHRVCEHGWD